MTRLRKEDYTVGWICALPIPEWQASRLLLDDEHEDAPLSSTQYQYAFGTMNGHNVVMGCLPDSQMGLCSAASVAAEMRSNFPLLRFALLVGIGGGVPSRAKDIRLGDVVVSRPEQAKRHGGVKQYDYGKAIQGDSFQLTGTLNTPPHILLSALGKVRSTRPRNSRFYEYLKSYHKYIDNTPEFAAFATPPKVDRLFESDYVHPTKEPTCSRCDSESEIRRSARPLGRPEVHYGIIASGNQVMKDAIKRDQISEELEGVLCFEMEAAGLMNHFPCLVVRGICDYCDSHKNKSWQPYAAAAAAAWAKELLRNIVAADVSRGDTIMQMSKQVIPEPVNMLPYDKDQDFVGREDTIQEIQSKFSDPEAHSRAALVGLGGVGKSQIAIEYGWRLRERRNDISIFWVHGSSPERFYNDYQSIATHLELSGFDKPKEDHLKIVTEWLKSQQSGKWLLIVDNADNKDFTASWKADLPNTTRFTLLEHMPNKRGCGILITSRDRHAAFDLVGSQENIIEAMPMTEIDAVHLFQKKTAARNWDAVQAHRLATQLDCIPLAITQAAAYIMQRQRMTISGYLELFQQAGHEERLLSESQNDLRRDPNVPNSVIKTWEITFRHIQTQNSKAAQLLSYMSFWDKQGIPEWLLRETESDRTAVDEALEMLLKFSLIRTASNDNHTLEMHRLVQLATKTWIRAKGEYQLSMYRALKLLWIHYPNQGFEQWRKCQLLEPHAEAAVRSSLAYRSSREEGSENLVTFPPPTIERHDNVRNVAALTAKIGEVRGRLLYNRTTYAIEQGRHMEAVEMAEIGQSDFRDTLGESHPDSLNFGCVLAVSYLHAGALDKAASVGVAIVEAQRDFAGAEHPDTLNTMTHVATVYRQLGMVEDAEKIFCDVIRMYERLPNIHDDSDESRGLLMSMNELAITYGDQEQWGKKEELERKIRNKSIEVKGESHPDTLSAMSNLAQTYRMQGRVEQAAEMLPTILERKKAILGPEHPNTLSSLSNLAHLYWEQNRREEALDLLADVLDKSKTACGEDHHTTLTHMVNLANFLKEMDREPEAMDLLETCAEKRSLLLGKDHSETVYARLMYNTLYEEQEFLLKFFEINGKEVPSSATTWPEGDEETAIPEAFEIDSDRDTEKISRV